jgi:hypothetical protein
MQRKSNLVYAQCCLEVLKYCDSLDPVAFHFHERLATIYQKLVEEQSEPAIKAVEIDMAVNIEATTQQDSNNSALPMGADKDDKLYSEVRYLFSLPRDTPIHYRQLSLDLLRMLCQPYDNPAQEQASDTSIKVRRHRESTRYEDLHMVERMDWDFEKATPFSWDLESLGVSSAIPPGEHEYSDASGCSDTIPASSRLGQQLDLVQTFTGNRLLGPQRPSGWAAANVIKTLHRVGYPYG